MKMNTAKLAKLAMMVAISCVLVLLIRIPFPPAPFLVYDPADVPIYITTFAFGPVAGLVVTIVVSFIQAFILGGDAVYGFVMHVFATGMFAVAAGAIYSRNKSKKGAIIEAVLNVSLSLVLVNFYGIIGVIIGTFVAMAYRTLDMVLYLSKNILQRSITKFLTEALVNIAVCVALKTIF